MDAAIMISYQRAVLGPFGLLSGCTCALNATATPRVEIPWALWVCSSVLGLLIQVDEGILNPTGDWAAIVQGLHCTGPVFSFVAVTSHTLRDSIGAVSILLVNDGLVWHNA